MQNIWEAIIKAGGVASVTFDTSPITTVEYPEDIPKCSTVPVVKERLDVAENTEAEDLPEIVKWDGNSSVKFQGNKAEFMQKRNLNR